MPGHQGDAIQSQCDAPALAQLVHHSGSFLGNQTRLAKHHGWGSGREELTRLQGKDKPSSSASSRRSFAATHVAALPGCPACLCCLHCCPAPAACSVCTACPDCASYSQNSGPTCPRGIRVPSPSPNGKDQTPAAASNSPAFLQTPHTMLGM